MAGESVCLANAWALIQYGQLRPHARGTGNVRRVYLDEADCKPSVELDLSWIQSPLLVMLNSNYQDELSRITSTWSHVVNRLEW